MKLQTAYYVRFNQIQKVTITGEAKNLKNGLEYLALCIFGRDEDDFEWLVEKGSKELCFNLDEVYRLRDEYAKILYNIEVEKFDKQYNELTNEKENSKNE